MDYFLMLVLSLIVGDAILIDYLFPEFVQTMASSLCTFGALPCGIALTHLCMECVL